MNQLRLCGCLVWIAACGSDPAESDTDPDSGRGCRDLVPDPYCFLWTPDAPCPNGGPRTYRLTEEAAWNADGTLSVLERWYVFWPDDPSRDAVDLLRLEAGPETRYSLEDMRCSQCEHLFRATLREVEVTSGWGYEGQQEVYAVDVLSPNNKPFEDNEMVMGRGLINGTGGLSDIRPLAARGTFVAQGAPGTLPATVSWGPYALTGACDAQ